MSSGAGPGGRNEDPLPNLFHQLRNPLSVIVGYAELVAERGDEASRREAAERILEAAQRLATMIDDLLIVFAVDSGRLVLELAAIDLEAAVAEAVSEIDERHGERRFSTRSLDGPWPTVLADSEQLSRILGSLLVNAWKRSTAGSEIAVNVRRENFFAAIDVADEGPALAEKEAGMLFNRFGNVDPAGRTELRGTGLELYKARRLVELHGGRISAGNRPEGGARIEFTLPLADDDAAEPRG